nr:MAG: nsp1a [Astroviridae sp.]
MAKFCAPPGTKTLYNTMRERYGGTESWKKLMQLDAITIKTTTHAVGYREGTFFSFTSKKMNDGWDCSYKMINDDELTEEEQLYLRAHAACQERMRAAQKLSSAIQDRCLRAQSRLRELEAELEMLKRKTVACQKPEITEVKTPKFNWRLIVVLCVAILVAFLPVSNAAQFPETDCRDYIDGCYLEQSLTGKELSYDEFVNVCYGRTRTRLTTSNVNETKLVTECQETLAKYHMENVAWMKDWCLTHIRQRLTPVKCTHVIWQEKLFSEVTDFFFFLQSSYKVFSMKFFHYLSVFVIVFTFMWEKKFFPALFLLLLTLGLKLPLFMASVAVNTLHPFSCVVYVLLLILEIPNAHWQWVVFVVHWVIMVLLAFFSNKETLQAVSIAVATSFFLPAWYFATRTVQIFEIPPAVQLLTFVLGLTWAIGIRYLSVTVTTTDVDGNVQKTKRYDLFKKTLTSTFLKIQNATRGVVPAIPEKSDSIVVIESSVGQGVGFRFMNYIITAGHVVGPDQHVKITFRGITCVAKVRTTMDLIECPETLVFLNLPAEMQALKPLRLSKVNTSDYMSLLCFDGSFQQVSQYTGWAAVDGSWISTAFETQPGNSGGPYIDRYGRLVGIHLGTQGVLAQGYKINTLLAEHHPRQVQEQSLSSTSSLNLDELGDQLLAKLIKGTKVSHAAILTELEKLVARVEQLEKDNKELEKSNQNLADMLVKALEDTPVFGFERKKKGRKFDRKAFNKVKVLTEEQYKEMLENGWSAEKISEAVEALRDSAFMQYQMDLEDEALPEDYINDEIEREFEKTGYYQVKDGVKTQTIMQGIIQQARRIRKRAPFTCKFCLKTFENWHDKAKCRKNQTKVAKEAAEKTEEPKNVKSGSKPSTPK